MARTVRKPTERQELERMTRQEIGRVAMRAHMILLSTRGFSALDIAEIHQVSDPAVYKWMDRFDEEGPEGLHDREREGRPPKIDEDVEAEIERLLEKPPTEAGYDFSRWTARRLARHLKKERGLDVHPDTVRRALKRPSVGSARQLEAPAALAAGRPGVPSSPAGRGRGHRHDRSPNHGPVRG